MWFIQSPLTPVPFLVREIGQEISKTFRYNKKYPSVLYTEHHGNVDSYRESLLMNLRGEEYGEMIWNSIGSWLTCALSRNADDLNNETTFELLR
jgi:hypothetical protein